VIFGIWIAWRGVSDVPRAGETPAATIPSAAPPPPAADAGASSDRTEKPAVSEQLRSLHDTARQQISAGRREEALDTVNAGLVLDASDPELNRLLDGFIDAAGQLAGQARLTAVRRGATDASSPEFREARADERNGVAFQKSGDRAQAVRALWAAAARYERAGELAARSTAARPVPPEAKSRPESAKEKVSTQPAPRQEQLPRQQVESLTRLPGTPTQPLSPPVSAEPDPGPPAAPDPARSARAADTAAINGTLQRYADAYEKRDAAAVLKVLPALTSSQLRDLERDFSNYRSYRVEITDIRIALRNGTATVMCTVVRSFETRSGLEGGNRVPTVFHLRKVGATWIIEGLESR
jgi:hypothetical protein